LPPHAVPDPDDVAPTQLDGLPPEIDADFAARMTSEELLHMECQGYRDSGFSERVLWYHVGFALRYRGKRRVRTVALWLIPLRSTQPRNQVASGDITEGDHDRAARSTCELTALRPGDDVLCGGLGRGGSDERSAVRAGGVGAPKAAGELARAAHGGGCSGDAGAV
jgi:hypothetical protein